MKRKLIILPALAFALIGIILVVVVASQTETVDEASTEDQIVYFYNWNDYMDEEVLDEFAEITGYTVVLDLFDANVVLDAKVLAGNSGYDLVVPSDTFLQKQILAGAYQPIDKSLLPNYDQLNPEIMAKLNEFDPDNRYGVPYMFGSVGLAYNVAALQERLGEDYAIDSWDLFFDPAVVSRLADCGVYALDEPADMMPIAMHYLGFNPHSESATETDAVVDLFFKIRPFIRKFHNSAQIDGLAAGDICLAVGWSGDMYEAISSGAEAMDSVEIAYFIPTEGSIVFTDILAIPKGDNVEVQGAHALINFLLDPQIAARNTNYTYYGNPVDASKPDVAPSILNNPNIYPDQQTLKRMFGPKMLSPEGQRLRTRAWQRITTGQ